VTEVCRVARALPALMARGGTAHSDMLGGGAHDNRAVGTVRSESGGGKVPSGLGKKEREKERE
jgi:hypothetical protein